MKKLIAFLILFFCYISCGPSKIVIIDNADNDVTYGYSQMYYVMDKTITKSQVDSMIFIDKLADLDKWPTNLTGDKNKHIVQYYYIKSDETNNELIYILTKTQVDTVFKCVKRVTKEIEE